MGLYLGRRCLRVDLGAGLLRLEGVHSEGLQAVKVAGLPREVVAHEGLLVGGLVWLGVGAHGPGLGVVVGRVGVQVVQVLGRVLADAQVAH